jgi:hypothetical protein
MTSRATLDAMSWIIAVGNVGSAVLVGPALLVLLLHLESRGTVPTATASRWLVGTMLVGWAALLGAQVTFAAFGFTSGYPGFKYLQPGMLPVALLNLAASVYLRRRSRSTTVKGERREATVAQP